MIRNPITRARQAVQAPRENVLARSVALNAAGRGTRLVMGFVTSIILARLLGPSNRGLLALMISLGTVVLAVSAFGQPNAVTYFASRKDANYRAILGNTLVHGLVLTLVFVPLSLLLHKQISDAFGHGQGGLTWGLAAALVPITYLDWATGNQLLGMLRFGLSAMIALGATIAYTVGVILLVGVFHLGVAGGLIATAAGSVVAVAGCWRPIVRSKRPTIDRPLFKDMVRYGSKVQVGVIFQMINYRLDVLIMQFFRPLNQVGYYVVAQTIAELVITLAVVFQSSVLPLVSHYEGDDRQRSVTVDSLHHHGIIAGFALLANSVFGTGLILYGYGHEFHPAVVPMLVLLPGIWFLGMGLVIQGDLSGRGLPGVSSRLAGLAAAVTVVLDFALIPPLGVMGGALASVTAYTTFGIASMIALHRITEIPLRELVVPTRKDLSLYLTFFRRLAAKVGPNSAT